MHVVVLGFAGLFIGRNGHRYEKFKSFPTITQSLLGTKINVTDWRKIMATAAADNLSPEEIKVMDKADTHSALTAERYYVKKGTLQTVTKAVKLTQSLYDRMDKTRTVPSSSPSSSSLLSSSSAAASSSSPSSSAAAVSADVQTGQASVPVLDPSKLLKLFTSRVRNAAPSRMRDANGMYCEIACLRAACDSVVWRRKR